MARSEAMFRLTALGPPLVHVTPTLLSTHPQARLPHWPGVHGFPGATIPPTLSTGHTGTKVSVPGYTKLDLALRWQATKHLELYARAENLLDEDYEEVFGFPALERFFGAGVTARF